MADIEITDEWIGLYDWALEECLLLTKVSQNRTTRLRVQTALCATSKPTSPLGIAGLLGKKITRLLFMQVHNGFPM